MIDLHCHTRISDGSYTSSELLQLSKELGITHIAITDHDTTAGLEHAMALGIEMGVEVIPGIELSAFDFKRNKRAHIIGLYIQPDHKALNDLCRLQVEERCTASSEMVNRLIAEGYKISWQQVEKHALGGTGVYKQHIMHALIESGYCSEIYCSLYKKLFSRGNGQDSQGIAFIPLTYIDAVDAIHAIRAAGGVAILAHPGQLSNYDAIGEWVKEGLEGVEAYHPSHNDTDEKYCLSLAKHYNLVVTGGNDFHGFYGEQPIMPGCIKLDDSCIKMLKQRHVENQRVMNNLV